MNLRPPSRRYDGKYIESMHDSNFIGLHRRFRLVIFVLFLITGAGKYVWAQPFVHPGCLHTMADLNRMKTNVLAGNHPWIDDWNRLLTDPQAKSNWNPAAHANMGVSRQRADADAHAVYLNTLRWNISGDTNFAECAVKICNVWSASVNQVPVGNDTPGLIGIPIFNFALAGELLRTYPGWKPADFNQFTNMMVRYLYPVCHDFLADHNGACVSYFWANWDACNIGALIAMGVLCDNTNIYHEGIEYFKQGAGMGSIYNAVPFLHTPNLGQWQESGRDQEHAQLGLGFLATACEVARHQGLDLYGTANNRLLAGAEYIAQFNLGKTVPYNYYNNCNNSKNFWPAANGRGRLNDRPIWEMIYNHYVVQQGLSAPNTTAMTQLMRPEHGSPDHFGYGTLTFTLNAAMSPYPPSPVPPIPTDLTATVGVSRVTLRWASRGDTAQGYTVSRSTTSDGPYSTIASWTANTIATYTDNHVVNGTTYYYVVAANNQSGTSGNSAPASATPVAAGKLPAGWAQHGIGTLFSTGRASYAGVCGNTFVIGGAGTGIGGTKDSCGFVCMNVTGDYIFTGRLLASNANKAGLMIRESLSSGAKSLALTLGEIGARGTRFRTRSSTGGSTSTESGNDYTTTPVWYRLQRSGNNFTASHSPDGVTWYNLGSSLVTMATNCYVGLTAVGKTATFDNVSFVPMSTPTGFERRSGQN
jgi:regulation of enolase protein 1 (concanavalin A-like superfamily)